MRAVQEGFHILEVLILVHCQRFQLCRRVSEAHSVFEESSPLKVQLI